jgi:hypothetical protein
VTRAPSSVQALADLPVGTHLYRIFPKLGITARGDLQTALSAAPGRK